MPEIFTMGRGNPTEAREKNGRGKAARNAAQKRMLDVLHAAGPAGITSPELTFRLGPLSDSSCTQRLRLLVSEGKAGEWLDPIGRCYTRKRYWHPEFMPAKCPPPSGMASGVGLRSLREQTHGAGWRETVKNGGKTLCGGPDRDFRHQVLPGEAPAVVRSSECRGWANAAASHMGESCRATKS